MAEMTLRLRCDPQTGKKDLVITLRSDEDALPHEHEQLHQALVEKLIHQGILKANELGEIVVERVSKETEAAPTATPTEEPQKQAESK
jgi:hypothetical protein